MTYTTKSQDDITNDILLSILDNVSTVNDANIGSVLRNYVESVSLEIKNLYDSLDEIYAGTRIDTSTGTDLEQLGKLVGITRKTGTQAEGLVTFIRNTVASADFTISANSAVATQPITGEDQLRFTTIANTTFSAENVDESHEFYDGVTNYRMVERTLGDTSNIAISGLISGVTSPITSFVVQTSWTGNIIDVDSVTMVDDCDDLVGWTSGVGATTIATSPIYVESSSSIALGKTISTSDNVYYEVNFPSRLSGSSKDFVPFIRLNSTSYDRLSKIDFYLSDNSTTSQSYLYSIDVTGLTEVDVTDEWYYNAFDINSATKNGNPSISNLNYLRVVLTTNSASQVLTSGDLLIDFLNFSETDFYIGDILQFDPQGPSLPDHATDYFVTYKPLSKDINCQATAVGDEYNVNRQKITYKITNITNITTLNNFEIMSGGSDLETDVELRERILFASELVGKGTAESIRQAVLGVNGIAAATVDDTPLISRTSEPHIFDTSVSKYKMDFEVLYLDNVTSPTNVEVIGTVSSSAGHTFLYGTDYIRVTDTFGVPTTELQWQVTGTMPDDTTTFYVDYQSNWLGHVNVFVTGVENPLPTSVLIDVEEAVEDTKAAGVEVAISTPTNVDVDVTAEISVLSTYTFSEVSTRVETAVFNFLNSLSAGNDVFISKIIDVIMGVVGVENTNVSLPAADITIANDEIAKPDVTTITEI